MGNNGILEDAVSRAKTVAVGGHVKPDGDCFGSCAGLYRYIRDRYPMTETDIYLEEIPESFRMIGTADVIRHEVPDGKEYDLFIALDCSDPNRLGFAKKLFDTAKKTLCVDHHVSNAAYASENYIVPEAGSTAEVLFGLMDREKISRETAECLFLGIAHDTGIFRFSCTSPETMEAAAFLMRKNIRASEIIRKTYYEKTYAQQKILGRALGESRLFSDGALIVSCVTEDMMRECGATVRDLDGIVSVLGDTAGTRAAVFLYETAPDEYKVSLRSSSEIDVSEVARHFGGGGHMRAAGATVSGNPREIVRAIVDRIGGCL